MSLCFLGAACVSLFFRSGLCLFFLGAACVPPFLGAA